jgi:hypothetical protein
MKVGQRVRCVINPSSVVFGVLGRFNGKVGTVRAVKMDPNPGRCVIDIAWDDGERDSPWTYASYFEPLQDQLFQPKHIQSHICKCGIARIDCIYHKDISQ